MRIQDLLAPEDSESTKSSTSSSYHDLIFDSDSQQDNYSSKKANKEDKVQKPNLTNQERQKIYDILNRSSFNGKLPRGILSEISERFKVKPRTISRIWHQGQESIASGLDQANVSSRIKLKSNLARKKYRFRPTLMKKHIFETDPAGITCQ